MEFLVPPETRLSAEPTSPSASLDPPDWTTAERLALVSLLAVTSSGISYFLVPPFLNIYAPLGPLVVVSTTLLAYVFWRRGRRVNDLRAALSYCLGRGALAGIANLWLFIVLTTLVTSGGMLNILNPKLAIMLTLFAAVVGVAFGIAYLLPMLTRLSARDLRPGESIDRCLTGFGFWGMLVLGLVLAVGSRYASMQAGAHHPMVVVAFTTLGAHALMFLVGLTRSVRRQWWLRHCPPVPKFPIGE